MCGIIALYKYGQCDKFDALKLVVESLKKIEYRGYDSAGFAFFDDINKRIIAKRTLGSISQIDIHAISLDYDIDVCIGHTRWATHGSSDNIKNAHPHTIDNLSIVHNGTINNIDQYYRMLKDMGYNFYSETDTEVALNLIHNYISEGNDPVEAFLSVKSDLSHDFTSAILFCDGHRRILMGSCGDIPLIVGVSNKRVILCSDLQVISDFAEKIVILERGDSVIIENDDFIIRNFMDRVMQREQISYQNVINASKKSYGSNHYLVQQQFQHDMHREIFEQKHVLADLPDRIRSQMSNELIECIKNAKRIILFSAGSSHYAAEYGVSLMQNIDVQKQFIAAISSEYSTVNIQTGDFVICISQSGETQDTLKALRHAQSFKGIQVAAIVNVYMSAIAREADHVLYMKLGSETSVASTKSFTGQMLALIGVALSILDNDKQLDISNDLTQINRYIEQSIRAVETFFTGNAAFAKCISMADYVFFISVRYLLSASKESALKLKEIAYIPCEGIPAGEVKHGPLALATSSTFAVAFMDNTNKYLESCISTLRARNASVLMIKTNDIEHSYNADYVIKIPTFKNKILNPILFAVTGQLISYWSGVLKGTSVDRPRNLSKSITVD